ncbi:MAG TPA: hypothetical protein VKB35_01805, partial [Ktedonobacteraceae bacterium]|nr:hypothetical protein [Ktedonobacteraceae bacterium]
RSPPCSSPYASASKGSLTGAARTVAAFSATLRNEVDLEQLREQLLAVVQETLQPAHVSLWLRQPEQPGRPGDHAPSL